tara:strand:+ start:13191 stop:14225 length:1035 start_codon:yes stop_codon:yes gene_type:complete
MQKLLSVLAALLVLNSSGLAQDEFSIPGVDDPAAVTNAASNPAPTPSNSGDNETKTRTEPKEYKNFLAKLIGVGGLFIWPLIFLSLVVAGLSVYCFIDIGKRNFVPDPVVKNLREDMEHGDVIGAKDRAERSKTCLGQVMAGATEFIGDRGYQVLDDNGLYDAMADASQEFNRGRARTINYLSVIAQSAPMIGLLGTVSGMIKAFDKLGGEGMGDPASLATNISEALFTTAAGLVIAVPSLFIYYYFRDRLAHFVAVTDKEAYRLLNTLRRAIVAKHSGGDAPPAAAAAVAQAPAEPAPQAYQPETPAPAPPPQPEPYQPEAPAPPPAAPQPYQPQPYKPSSEQ